MVWLILTGLLLGALGAGELAIRFAGLTGFPLFAGSGPDYRMKADQAGRFRRRNVWRYDRFGQRTDQDVPDLSGLCVVVGDSVVDGGNHVSQAETLAAQLGALVPEPVYPVGCHGWSLANELAVLRSLPGWDRAARLVFVLNTGDFDAVGTPASGFSFPARRPVLALPWLVLRKLYRTPAVGRMLGWRPPPRFDPAVRAAILAQFAEAMALYDGPVALVRYPRIGEDPAQEAFYANLAEAAGQSRTRLIDLAGRGDWGNDCYLDHIHPNSQGIRVLAHAIAQGVY